MRTTSSSVLAIPTQSVALLAVLMLRGPQTVGELRINCERLHRFSDISAVEGFLHELAARAAGALVVELAAPARRARDALGASAVRSAATDSVVRMRRGGRRRHGVGIGGAARQCRRTCKANSSANPGHGGEAVR